MPEIWLEIKMYEIKSQFQVYPISTDVQNGMFAYDQGKIMFQSVVKLEIFKWI